MANEQVEGWVTEHAAAAVAFYKALVEGSVPQQTASGMVQEFNHQSLRAHFQK